MIKGKLFKGLFLPFLVGLICAVVSAVLLFRYVQEIQQKQNVAIVDSSNSRMPVVVSTLPLNAGVVINADHLRVRELDELSLPNDVIFPSDAKNIIGQQVRSDLRGQIAAGKPIQWLHLQPNSSSSFAGAIAPGLVPFSLPINSLEHHSGLLQAGDILDLYANVNGYAELILERAEVLATGSVTKELALQQAVNTHPHLNGAVPRGQQDYQQITLAVPLKRYFELQQLSENRRLWPIVRSSSDTLRLRQLQGAKQIEIITPGQSLILQELP